MTSATTSPHDAVGSDLIAVLAELTGYLESILPGGLSGPLSASLIAGGRSNLTYILTDGVGRWVLRRPPLGHVLASAHDMGREVRVLRALTGSAVPVPAVLGHCTDTGLLGAEFYVMSFADGVTYREDAQFAALSAPAATKLSHALIDTLADLHAIDPAAVGLSSFGRPEGYLERQLRRWGTQLEASRCRDVPGFERLAALLAADVPVSARAGVVHGDFRQDNVIVAPDAPGEIRAVLDWEMATLGDPMTDLGMFALYWEGWAGLDNPITAVPGDHPAFPRQGDLIARYASRTGADLDRFGWYLGFAYFKLAVILEGIHFRYVEGLTVGEGFGRIGAMVPVLVNRGVAVLDA